MELIDTHSHIDLPVFQDDFYDVLARARKTGVVAQVLPGVIRSGWNRILQLSDTESDLYPAIGLHPMYLSHHGKNDLTALQEEVNTGSLVAIGEIGLDYFIKDVSRLAQQELFEAQVKIAKKAGLPVLLHVRKAHDQVQSTLRRLNFGGGGIVHAFSGSFQQADHYIKLGFMISICGTITYDRATKIRSVAAALPLTSLVLETDSPDIPPASHHKERNSPEYLYEIAHALSELRDVPIETVARQTSENARKCLGL